MPSWAARRPRPGVVAGEQEGTGSGHGGDPSDRVGGAVACRSVSPSTPSPWPVDPHDDRGVAGFFEFVDDRPAASWSSRRVGLPTSTRVSPTRAVTPRPGMEGTLRAATQSQPGVVRRVDDRTGQRVFGRILRGGGQRQHLARRRWRSGAAGGSACSRGRAFGEGAGLVEGDKGDGAELFEHDGGFHQHAVAPGSWRSPTAAAASWQHQRARRGDDHERHRPQQCRLQISAPTAAEPRTGRPWQSPWPASSAVRPSR